MEETMQEQMEREIRESMDKLYPKDPDHLYSKMQIEFYSCSYEKKSVTLRFPIQRWELNHMSTVHGGIIASAIDTACGTAVRKRQRQDYDPYHKSEYQLSFSGNGRGTPCW